MICRVGSDALLAHKHLAGPHTDPPAHSEFGRLTSPQRYALPASVAAAARTSRVAGFPRGRRWPETWRGILRKVRAEFRERSELRDCTRVRSFVICRPLPHLVKDFAPTNAPHEGRVRASIRHQYGGFRLGHRLRTGTHLVDNSLSVMVACPKSSTVSLAVLRDSGIRRPSTQPLAQCVISSTMSLKPPNIANRGHMRIVNRKMCMEYTRLYTGTYIPVWYIGTSVFNWILE